MVRPDTDDSGDEELEAARLALLHHAFQRKPPPAGLDRRLEPMAPAEAAAIVASHAKPSEQRVVLAALLTDPQLREGVTGAMDAIRILAQALLPNNESALREMLEVKLERLGPEGAFDAQRKVVEIINKHSIGGGACSYEEPTVWVEQDEGSITTAICRIVIEENPESVNRVVKLLHPWRWHDNYPNYFVHSYATLGALISGSKFVAKEYVPPILPLLSAPWGHKISTTHPKELLYEELRIPTDLKHPYQDQCRYRNLLKVDWSGVSPMNGFDMRMDYQLNTSLFAFIKDLYDSAGGLWNDEGFMTATRNSETSWTWTGLKTIRFKDLTEGDPLPGVPDFGELMNWVAPAVLGNFLWRGMESSCCP